MNGMQRLARAERDCVDLHQALAEAIRRMSATEQILRKRPVTTPPREYPDLEYRDLMDVLARTSRPVPQDDGCYAAGGVDTPGLHRPDCNAIRNGGPCDAGLGAVSQ